ncbi:MAG: ATP-binding cassette domain-containing protein, partial [Bacteroidia bacterium]
MTYPLLEIKNLSIDFVTGPESFSAVKNISFTLNKGETIAIVGESGSGKTVSSLSILQLLPSPLAQYKNGEILFSEDDGKQVNLLGLDEKYLRKIRGNKISMIFQEPMTSLNPVQTCGGQVMEALMLHERLKPGEAKTRTIELFNQVKLPDAAGMLHRYPHQLSGGQKQRVMIAMAMSCNPSILIADEPTTALDVTVQKTILQLIKELQQKQQMGVIYITHDLALVSEIADKVIVMYKGSIVETNTTKEIFSNPKHPYTKALIDCRPSPASKGKRLPVISDFLNGSNDWDTKRIICKENKGEVVEPVTDLLKVENLKVYFPIKKSFTGKILKEFKAVDDVSFSVKKGEILGLVGESGCGKTTLGRALIRLIEPTSGNIFLNKKNIAHIPNEELRRMRKDIQIIF